jgi:hypothetical protein
VGISPSSLSADGERPIMRDRMRACGARSKSADSQKFSQAHKHIGGGDDGVCGVRRCSVDSQKGKKAEREGPHVCLARRFGIARISLVTRFQPSIAGMLGAAGGRGLMLNIGWGLRVLC